MIDILLKACLKVTQESVIIPLSLVGFMWIHRTIFFGAMTLIVFNMIFNHALKITFGVPLMPHLKTGFAFPSGHMSGALVFYGFLDRSFKNIFLSILITLMLIGVGYGLMHFNYHTLWDVLGALFFGLILLTLYMKGVSPQKPLSMIILSLIGAGLMAYIAFKEKAIPQHVFMGGYCLLSFTLMSFVSATSLKLFQKIFATLLAFGLIFGLQSALPLLKTFPAYISQMPWLLVGAILIISERSAKKIL